MWITHLPWPGMRSDRSNSTPSMSSYKTSLWHMCHFSTVSIYPSNEQHLFDAMCIDHLSDWLDYYAQGRIISMSLEEDRCDLLEIRWLHISNVIKLHKMISYGSAWHLHLAATLWQPYLQIVGHNLRYVNFHLSISEIRRKRFDAVERGTPLPVYK